MRRSGTNTLRRNTKGGGSLRRLQILPDVIYQTPVCEMNLVLK
jgi:hypothetical protein